MTRTRSMASLKNIIISSSSSFEVEYISSDSLEAESFEPSLSTKKHPSTKNKKKAKKPDLSLPESFSEYSLKFWGLEHKIRYVAFSKCLIVPGRVINFEQLEASDCTVSSFFGAQELSMLLHPCGLEFSVELVRLFYANLRISLHNGERETLGNRILLNDFIFKDVFGSEFSGDIPCMHGNLWPESFGTSMDSAKLLVSESGVDLTTFGPLLLALRTAYSLILWPLISYLGKVPSLTSLTKMFLCFIVC